MGILSKHIIGDEEARLETMLESMRYEPFFCSGRFCDSDKGIFIGYTTLQGSFSDCMPIYNETKRILLFLTGEVYSSSRSISFLRQKGHQFAENDASYLVHLFEEDEKGFFAGLNGSHNGLLVDLNRNRVILFNDRYGVRRIYYSETESGLVFSAEAKALLRAFPSFKEINQNSIGEYLVYDCILQNKTLFKDIQILPPASVWYFQNSHITKIRYHDPKDSESFPKLSPKDFSERFIETFKNIMPRYLAGNSLGLGLTAGFDTRSILAAADPKPGQLPCYTFGMRNPELRDIEDIRIAPAVAAVCQQPHSVLDVEEKEFLNDFPSLVNRIIYVSDGSGDVVTTSKIVHHKMARQISHVWLNGKYGTEVLKNGRGLKREFAPCQRLINKDFAHFLSAARATRAALGSSHSFPFYLSVDLPWWWHKYIAIESTQVEVRSPYLDNDIIDLVYKAPAMSTGSREQIQWDFIHRYKPFLMEVPSTSAHKGTTTCWNRRVFRFLAMADKFYLRERVPYGLTHTFGKIDWFLRPFHLERPFIGMTSFQRYRTWFRDQLSQYLVDTLLCPRTYARPYWDKTFLNKAVQDHIKGKGTYLLELRKVLQVELVHRVLLE